MSVKKLLILSAAAAISTVAMSGAFAGGPAVPPPPANNGFYVEGNVGYGLANFDDANNFVAAPGSLLGSYEFTGNKNGGFVFGVDAGYQWNQHFAAELGWYYLPEVDFTTQSFAGHPSIRSWALYAAIKMMAPIPMYHNMSVFFKAGLVYRLACFHNYGSYNGDQSKSIRPMFALGFQYLYNHAWIFDLQYMYFAAVNQWSTSYMYNVGGLTLPATHLFTFSLGYMFSM